MKSMIRRETKDQTQGVLISMSALEARRIAEVLKKAAFTKPQMVKLANHLSACGKRLENPKLSDKGWVNTDD